jgi:hypothetical protein
MTAVESVLGVPVCFARRKWANRLPVNSASNILRVQGVEKQASSICKISDKASRVAGSIA